MRSAGKPIFKSKSSAAERLAVTNYCFVDLSKSVKNAFKWRFFTCGMITIRMQSRRGTYEINHPFFLNSCAVAFELLVRNAIMLSVGLITSSNPDDLIASVR